MTNFQSSTLRPGLLVSLKTSVIGNVSYFKTEIEADHQTKDGKRKAKWETERTIADAEEHEAAAKVRSKASTLIRGVCARSAFGLLCPESASDDLDKVVAQARRLCDDFNTTAKLSRIHLYVIAGRIAPDDVEAVRAINSEVRDLLKDMERGLANLDVKAVRAAANQAKNIGGMLSAEASARIQIAIDAARTSAKKIVQAGETTAAEIDKVSIRKIAEMRTAFLDLDDAKKIEKPTAKGRGVDLTSDTTAVFAPAPSRRVSRRSKLEV